MIQQLCNRRIKINIKQSQLCPMTNLSDGQKCRVAFAYICSLSPNLLLLDEPTNHLDIETIDSLAEAIREYQGGMVLVSHDFRYLLLFIVQYLKIYIFFFISKSLLLLVSHDFKFGFVF